MLGRREPRGRLHQPGKHRRLGEAEPLRIAPEIMMRGRAKPINAVAEIDAREVAREDLLLGQPGLEPEGDDHLLGLAFDGAVAGQKAGLGELLGDGRAALAHATAAKVGEKRAADPARVDPPMGIEAAILDGDERRRRHRTELGDVDRGFLDRAAQCDRMAIVAQQQQGRIGKRLERA